MLSVEERQALILAAEEALHAVKTAAATPARTPKADRLDTVLRLAIAAENAQRRFYETLNELTRWYEHPAVAEPQP